MSFTSCRHSSKPFQGVASFGEGFKTVFDQFGETATKHNLFAKEVGFGFFFEGGFDDTSAGATEASTVSQGSLLGAAGGVLVNGDELGNAAADFKLRTNGVTGAHGGDHGNVDVLAGLDEAEVDVEAVGEHQHGAGLEVILDAGFVNFRGEFVGDEHHHHIGFGGLRDGQGSKLVFLGLLSGGTGSFMDTDDNVHTAIAQVLRVGVALAAVADDGNGFLF